jgi:Ribbon-helix-helix protein, copG family
MNLVSDELKEFLLNGGYANIPINKVRLNLEISKELDRKVKLFAKACGVSKSELIRVLLRDLVEGH